MKQPKNLFGRRLREARTATGLSQKRLGVAVGIDESVASARMNQYEVGTHWPSFETAAKLAKVLNVPTPYFYTEDDLLARIIAKLGRMKARERQRILDTIEEMEKGHPVRR